MQYKAELHLMINKDTTDAQGNLNGNPSEKLIAPISSFSVEGGAKRSINLNSTDEISISSEFEQARTNKNIIFFIPPTKDFLAAKLIGLRLGSDINFFDMTFIVNIYCGRIKTQTLRLSSDGAWFIRTPTPLGRTPPLLMAPVHFHDSQLLHGHFDGHRKKLVYEEM